MGVFRDVELHDLELAGERLLLRRWRPDDANAVHAVMQDRSMWEFLALPDPYSLEVARGFVTHLGQEGRDEGTGMGCAVVERSSGRLVGSASIRLEHAATTGAEIGYWIARAARGHGYAAEATTLLGDWAFGLGVERTRLLTDTRNLGSAWTALRAGYRFEGIDRGPLPAPGEPNSLAHCDLARFGRLATDPPGPTAPAYPPLPAGGLGDGVLTLRVAIAQDASPMHHALTDELSRRWEFTPDPRAPELAQREATNAALHALVGPALRLTMVDVATGAYAGDISLRPGPPQVAAIGYLVHPDFRGRGYTTRALRLLVPWAFEVVGYGRLELGAKVANVASQRAAERAGFVRETVCRGRLRNVDGSFSDEAMYALVNPRYSGSESRISP